ncbi:MAG: hypothetical protein ACFB2Z_13450 [Maricaulaceae bacterium]
MFRKVLIAAALISVAACASPTPYQQAFKNRPGYSEARLEDDRFRVQFSGNSLTDRQTVETYVLFRAAELTLQNGYDYFTIVLRDIDANRRISGTSFNNGFGVFGGFGGGGFFFSRGFGGLGGGISTFNAREIRSFSAIAEVQLHEGDKPDTPNAFDAREVQRNLQNEVIRAGRA